MLTLRETARLRIFLLCHDTRNMDPVAAADQGTSMADARAALCLAVGVPINDISPGGYDLTEAAYLSVRASHIGHLAMFGCRSPVLGPPAAAAVMEMWRAWRPGYGAAGHDWLAAAAQQHAARFPAGCCHPDYCEWCYPPSRLAAAARPA